MHKRVKWSAIAMLGLALDVVWPAHAGVDLPGALTQAAPQMRMLGSGKLTWFGMHVYDAALWAPAASFDPSAPFALAIRYTRDLKGSRIAERSMQELERLGYSEPAKLSRWGEAMARLLPDVRAGERLTGVYLPGQGAEFYHQDRLLGVIGDPEFARAFFSIWLDPRTREPKLREQLIGVRR